MTNLVAGPTGVNRNSEYGVVIQAEGVPWQRIGLVARLDMEIGMGKVRAGFRDEAVMAGHAGPQDVATLSGRRLLRSFNFGPLRPKWSRDGTGLSFSRSRCGTRRRHAERGLNSCDSDSDQEVGVLRRGYRGVNDRAVVAWSVGRAKEPVRPMGLRGFNRWDSEQAGAEQTTGRPRETASDGDGLRGRFHRESLLRSRGRWPVLCLFLRSSCHRPSLS